ncbi:hypothetical protein HPB51_002205 [Rhipicephalus microplus]|uniref:Uncharacterized protein n=1 Tax=Rhipicephalus microplus TaxID=6941 RepID=A0A9J6EKI3_RHIMP|nr:hypothetical protein HPB51_002205 [Rhipicephalus microplus]
MTATPPFVQLASKFWHLEDPFSVDTEVPMVSTSDTTMRLWAPRPGSTAGPSIESLAYTQVLQGFWECLSALQDLEDQLRLTASPGALLASKLNEDPKLDAKLVEAVKIVMLKSALELFAAQKDSDAPCPLFATVLFSQVTATSPEEHLVSHVSRLGKSRAVPEADLYLLGYALGTTLTVVRPGSRRQRRLREPLPRVAGWQLARGCACPTRGTLLGVRYVTAPAFLENPLVKCCVT